jgi:hypothetical protein
MTVDLAADQRRGEGYPDRRRVAHRVVGWTNPGGGEVRRAGRASLALMRGFGLGCAKAHPGAPTSARHGDSSFRVLAETEVVNGEPEPSSETITAIHPFAENQAPSYPDEALRAGCSDGLVPVRVHVGIDGRVAEIRRIPGRMVAFDACYGAMETAVQQAVVAWRFVPAYRVRRLPAGTPSGEPTVERVPLGLDLDYEFLFSVVGGKGTVRSK